MMQRLVLAFAMTTALASAEGAHYDFYQKNGQNVLGAEIVAERVVSLGMYKNILQGSTANVYALKTERYLTHNFLCGENCYKGY